MSKSMNAKERVMLVLNHLILIAVSVMFIFPFAWMVFGMFKSNNEIWQQPGKLLPDNWDFSALLHNLGQTTLGGYIFNSFMVGIIGTVIIIGTAVLFIYVVVFMRTRVTDVVFATVLLLYMLPAAVTYVPSFVILARLGLVDSHAGLIFTYMANIFAAFYLRQSFKKTSMDYIDAGRIDGVGHLGTLRHIVLPLNRSAVVTLSMLTFITQYNNYMWPSILLKSQDKYLISQGLRQFFIQDGAYGMNWALVMMASTVAILPLVVLFIFGQNWLVTGIKEDSGLK